MFEHWAVVNITKRQGLAQPLTTRGDSAFGTRGELGEGDLAAIIMVIGSPSLLHLTF